MNHGICATRKLRTTDERCIPHTIRAIVLSVTTDRHVNKKPNARMMPCLFAKVIELLKQCGR